MPPKRSTTATNKQPSPSKKPTTKRGTSATNKQKVETNHAGSIPPDDLSFCYSGASPKEKEMAYFARLKDLFDKKQTMPEEDKFTENLKTLYDDLLRELCKCCHEPFEPMFQENDEKVSDKPKNENNIQRSSHNEVECRNKLASCSARISDLEQQLKEVSQQLEHSNEEKSKFQMQIASQCKAHADEISKLKKDNSELEKTIKGQNTSINTVDPKEVKELRGKLHNQEQNLNNKSKRIEDLENKTDKLVKENGKLVKENEELAKANHILEKGLKDEENKKLKLQKDIEINKQTEKANTPQELPDVERRQLISKINQLENQVQKYEIKIDDLEKIKTKSAEEITKLTYENKRLQDKIKELEDQRNKAQEKIAVITAEKDSLQTVMDDIKQQLEEEKNKLKREKKSPDQKLKEIEEENERLRDRLSQIAGNKLTERNPAIADLGDPNRPTQLGEKFSELYDNEWTDAMEALGNAGDEKSNISTLRTIVEKAYDFGKTRAVEYLKGMDQALINISNSIQVNPTITKYNKDHRKNISLYVIDALYQSFLGSHTEFNVGGDAVKAFIKKTVTLCWLMAIQDPPVVLTTKTSGKLDTNIFRPYTKSGASVDYVVWPVVFLHDGGPVICKGVAQGK